MTLPCLAVTAMLVLCQGPEPDSTSVPAQADGSARRKMTQHAMAALESSPGGFTLSLDYHGPGARESRSLVLSTGPGRAPGTSGRVVRLSDRQAATLVGYLARDWFFYRGAVNRESLLRVPEEPYYLLKVFAEDVDAYHEYLPGSAGAYRWHHMERPPMIEQLRDLRSALVGDAGRALDEVIAGLGEDGEKR